MNEQPLSSDRGTPGPSRVEWAVVAALLTVSAAWSAVEWLRGRPNVVGLLAGVVGLAVVGKQLLQRPHGRAARWLEIVATMGAGAMLYALIQRWGS